MNNGPSQRQLRVGEQLRHVIAEIIQQGHFADPILIDHSSAVSVTEVRTSPDLKQATAFIITLGGAHLEEILPALNESSAYVQKEINRKLNLKFTPRIKFMKDESYDEGSKIDNILRNLPKSQQAE